MLNSTSEAQSVLFRKVCNTLRQEMTNLLPPSLGFLLKTLLPPFHLLIFLIDGKIGVRLEHSSVLFRLVQILFDFLALFVEREILRVVREDALIVEHEFGDVELLNVALEVQQLLLKSRETLELNNKQTLGKAIYFATHSIISVHTVLCMLQNTSVLHLSQGRVTHCQHI